MLLGCVCVCVCVCVGGVAQQETGRLGGGEGIEAQVLNSQLGPLCQALTLLSCKPWTLLSLGSISIVSVSPAPNLGFTSGALPYVRSLLSEIHFPETAVCQGPLHATETRWHWSRNLRMGQEAMQTCGETTFRQSWQQVHSRRVSTHLQCSRNQWDRKVWGMGSVSGWESWPRWHHTGPDRPGKESGLYPEWNEEDTLLKISQNL